MTTDVTWTPDCFFDIVRSRRTVRVYTSDPVPDEDLTRILDAARHAPSSGNQQPWRFLVVRDRDTLDALHEDALALTLEAVREHLLKMEPEDAAAQQANLTTYLKGFMSAPVYVVILLDTTAPYPTYMVQDGAMAASHLMLAARALGYGTAYGTDAIPERALRRVLNIPEQYQFLCIIPIGKPEAWPPTPEKRDLSDFVIYERM